MQDDQQHMQPLPNEPTSPAETTVPASVPTEAESRSGAAPVSSGDAIWISKEEYQRLKQAEAAQAQSATKGPVKLFGGMQKATSALAAVGLLLGLTVSQGSAFMSAFVAVSLMILALTAGFTWLDYVQAKKTGQVNEHKTRNAVMFVFALICFALPVAFPMIGVLFFLLMCSFTSCRGS